MNKRAAFVPFDEVDQLYCGLGHENHEIYTTHGSQTLPDAPLVSLHADEVLSYLAKEVRTSTLDSIEKHLWLVGTHDSRHITPLHEQTLRGREVVITEDPELHLLWIENKIFVKPIPPYLLSYAFWSFYLVTNQVNSPSSQEKTLKAALGYMRTYSYLVRHRSDYRLAMQHHLIPDDLDITFESFMRFINTFSCISDEACSPRYQYGQLRLSRLNFWVKIFLRRSCFYETTWQYAEFFAKFYGPLLFIFGIVSVILSAMQVGVQARPSWRYYTNVSAWFSVACLLLMLSIGLALVLGFLLMLSRELNFALRHQYSLRKERRRLKAEQRSAQDLLEKAS